MRLSLFRRALVPVAAATLLLAPSPALAAPPPPFRDPALPLATRIDDLLSRLTPDEKISLLHQYEPAIPRLGIGVFKTGTEALHGVAWSNDYDNNGAVVKADGTAFPQAIGLASTWDPALMQAGRLGGRRRGARLQRRRTRPCGGSTSGRRWSTCCATRAGAATRRATPRTRTLTAASSRPRTAAGCRATTRDHLKAAPTLKHFLAYNNEVNRDTQLVEVPPRCCTSTTSRRSRSPLQAGAATGVMAVVQPGQRAPQPREPGPRRQAAEVGAAGPLFNVSDAGRAVQPDRLRAVLRHPGRGGRGGDQGGARQLHRQRHRRRSPSPRSSRHSSKGLLTIADVENADRHALSLRFRLGEFDPPAAARTRRSPRPSSTARAPGPGAQGRRRAGRAAANNANALPLNAAQNKKVAVVGPLADTLYTDWYGGAIRRTKVTPVQGIGERLGSAGTVASSEGVDRIALKDVATGRYVTARRHDRHGDRRRDRRGHGRIRSTSSTGVRATSRCATAANGKFLGYNWRRASSTTTTSPTAGSSSSSSSSTPSPTAATCCDYAGYET